MTSHVAQIGRYLIEREVGRGSMGVVYKAFDPVVERAVAVKTISVDARNAIELISRLRREARSIGQLEHANIVTLYDAGESGGLFYMVMQFVEGETLRSLLNRCPGLELSEIKGILPQICAALDYAHERGVIHRDVKPGNIMIANDGLVKLTDFGIAKLVNEGIF